MDFRLIVLIVLLASLARPAFPCGGAEVAASREKDAGRQPGELSGIGALAYTRAGVPVFKLFGVSGTLDTIGAQGEFRNGQDFTFDTLQKARDSGVAMRMEAARTRVAGMR